MTPTISIVLPTFNREHFLPEALDAIKGQSFTDWELIVVDDGSTDQTADLVNELFKQIRQPCRLIRQSNAGPYAARNTGIDHVCGNLVAFYDSDDLWLPHHLKESHAVLQSLPDVDWVYSATRIVDLDRDEVLEPNCFYDGDRPKPFVDRRFLHQNNVYLIPRSDAVRIAINDSLYCGLQTSVIRRSVFENRRLPPFRVGEDQLFALMAVADGVRLACIDHVHVVYRKHQGSTCCSESKGWRENVTSRQTLIRALSTALDEAGLSRWETNQLRKRLNRDVFWGVGYPMQSNGCTKEAMAEYLRALRLWPFRINQYKTMLGCGLQWLTARNGVSN